MLIWPLHVEVIYVCLKRNVCKFNSFQISLFCGNVLISGVRAGSIKERRKSVRLAHFRLLILQLGRSSIGISTNVGNHFRPREGTERNVLFPWKGHLDVLCNWFRMLSNTMRLFALYANHVSLCLAHFSTSLVSLDIALILTWRKQYELYCFSVNYIGTYFVFINIAVSTA
jgi:hypothetical protein